MHVCMIHTMRVRTCSRSRFGMCYSHNLSDTDCSPCKRHSSFLSRSFNYNLVNYGHGQRSRSESLVEFRANSSIDTICSPKASTILLEDKSRASQSHSLSRPQMRKVFRKSPSHLYHLVVKLHRGIASKTMGGDSLISYKIVPLLAGM
jgi:hypothetical protein